MAFCLSVVVMVVVVCRYRDGFEPRCKVCMDGGVKRV